MIGTNRCIIAERSRREYGSCERKRNWNPSFRELNGRQAGCYSNMLEEPIKYCPPTKTKRKKPAIAKAMEGNGDAKAGKTGVNQGVEEWVGACKRKENYVRYIYVAAKCTSAVWTNSGNRYENRIPSHISQISQFGTMVFLCIVNKSYNILKKFPEKGRNNFVLKRLVFLKF